MKPYTWSERNDTGIKLLPEIMLWPMMRDVSTILAQGRRSAGSLEVKDPPVVWRNVLGKK